MDNFINASESTETDGGKTDSEYNIRINTKIEKLEKTVSYKHYSVLPIVVIFMYAFFSTSTTMILFGPFSIGMTLFPNKSSANTYGRSSSLCTVNTSSEEFKDSIIVNEYASVLNIYFTLASGLPSIISNVLFGAFSDYFGRKFLFIIPIIGSLVKNIACIVGIYYKMNYLVLIAGFLVEGITGVFFSMLLGGFAVVADITESDQRRSLGIALLTLGIGVSTVVGSAGTGYFISATNSFIWPLVLSCGLLVLCLFIAICILPETYIVEGDKEKNCRVVTTYIKEVFGFYYKKSSNRGMYNLCIWAFIFTNCEWKNNCRDVVSTESPILLEHYRGALLGSVAAIETACYMGGTVLTNAVYAKTESIMGGFVFFVMGGCSFLSMVLLL
ncbi:hypothetical protein FSP39_012749 [Pinctada imbricata]|uniref:Uncharacterized protein n=1 Tax=Pinctada imbricata TaxID=66713 RepID=A0AA88Y6E0_PINIB|nr:hypothetical protein FSP39_012749 [Pinctada imbricata]